MLRGSLEIGQLLHGERPKRKDEKSTNVSYIGYKSKGQSFLIKRSLVAS